MELELDEETTKKILGIWHLTKHISGLKFIIVNESMRITSTGGIITDIPLSIFMNLAGTEIIEIIEREKEKLYGRR